LAEASAGVTRQTTVLVRFMVQSLASQ